MEPDPLVRGVEHGWAIRLSAALGALVTGGVIVASRRFGHHGAAVAS